MNINDLVRVRNIIREMFNSRNSGERFEQKGSKQVSEDVKSFILQRDEDILCAD